MRLWKAEEEENYFVSDATMEEAAKNPDDWHHDGPEMYQPKDRWPLQDGGR
jgi:hypothetical protein